ncbi:MAG TPA: hydroxyacylglutathione hydrolase [Gammaproteobacteria bacterium]
MPSLTAIAVPAFADNYLWLVQGSRDPGCVAVVDPGDAAAVRAALDARSFELGAILVTHHHADHTGGVAELLRQTGAAVWRPAGESVPVPGTAVRGGDRVLLERLGLAFDVLDVPGHTAGHVAYYGHGAVFCGDTLFSGGCGRMFEGTPEEMLASLDRLAALPGDTRVYCAHEYTLANLRFALEVDPDNDALRTWRDEAAALRARGQPTLPSTIRREREVNPFLRCRTDAVRRAAERHAGVALGSPAAVFAAVRQWKDGFR